MRNPTATCSSIEETIAKAVTKAVVDTQEVLGHMCSYAARFKGRWSNLGELAAVQLRAYVDWTSKNPSRDYGVAKWDTVDGVATYQSATGRVRISADERRGIVEVSCWAGPNGDRPARVAASVTYLTTGGYTAEGQMWVSVDEFVDAELVTGRPDRIEHLIMIDRAVFGNAMACSPAGREIRDLYSSQCEEDWPDVSQTQ